MGRGWAAPWCRCKSLLLASVLIGASLQVGAGGKPTPGGGGRPAAGDQALAELLGAHDVGDMESLFARALELDNASASKSSYKVGLASEPRRIVQVLARHGHAGAQVALAEDMLAGQLGRRDVAGAVSLVQEAASQGNAAGQALLGRLYAMGIGVAMNPALAVTYYYFAAEAGNPLAQLSLAYRHLQGVDVPRSCAKALMYYTPVAEVVVAAAQGPTARGMLIEKARLVDGPARVGRRLLRDEDDIVQYYHYSAEKGSVDAQLTLGQLAYHGARGMRRDPLMALDYWKRAADGGEAAAHSHIGHLYAEGIGVPQDNETALHHFRKGAAKGHPAALNGLGYMYMYGYGVDVSYQKALEHFRSAADKGNAEAQFNLGAMHVAGMGVKRAYDKALHFFTLAAAQGHTLALYNLGQMHLNGLGAPRSCAVAVQFLKAVAERGDWGAALDKAHRAFSVDGDVFRSVFLYGVLAEGGYEVAQYNVAHALDHSIRRDTDAADFAGFADPRILALEMYSRAAQQSNVEAQIKLGDFYFYGLGTKARRAGCRAPYRARVHASAPHHHPAAAAALRAQEDHKQAVAHYRTASEGQNAQAMFNLAYMHAHGLGLSRDFHLAKRHYDMALETASEAFVPVKVGAVTPLLMRTAALTRSRAVPPRSWPCANSTPCRSWSASRRGTRACRCPRKSRA